MLSEPYSSAATNIKDDKFIVKKGFLDFTTLCGALCGGYFSKCLCLVSMHNFV